MSEPAQRLHDHSPGVVIRQGNAPEHVRTTVQGGTDSIEDRRCNAMSVDVEEYFQVWALAQVVDRDSWSTLPSRVERSVETTLELFAAAGARATFFTLGWIAERHSRLIRKISEAGHEIASHGYAHEKVTGQDREEFRKDISRAKKILEDTSGNEVSGYRAPSFSIGAGNLWALDVLREAGYRYSSSIYPVVHDHYGMPHAPRFAFRSRAGGIIEIPMSTLRLFGRNLPCGGGGYFRLVPYRYFRWAIRRLNDREGEAAVFYFHPWELDPEQPRMKGLPLKSKFRHYVNLGRMERRLARLLADFRWDRMDKVFLDT